MCFNWRPKILKSSAPPEKILEGGLQPLLPTPMMVLAHLRELLILKCVESGWVSWQSFVTFIALIDIFDAVMHCFARPLAIDIRAFVKCHG